VLSDQELACYGGGVVSGSALLLHCWSYNSALLRADVLPCCIYSCRHLCILVLLHFCVFVYYALLTRSGRSLHYTKVTLYLCYRRGRYKTFHPRKNERTEELTRLLISRTESHELEKILNNEERRTERVYERSDYDRTDYDRTVYERRNQPNRNHRRRRNPPTTQNNQRRSQYRRLLPTSQNRTNNEQWPNCL